MSFPSHQNGYQMSFDFRDGDCSPPEPQSEYSRFAERVLPMLYLCRNARRTAQVMALSSISPSATRIAHDFVTAIAELDARIRSTGVYDFSEVSALENDHLRMDEVCGVLGEVVDRLGRLTLVTAEQITRCGDRPALALLQPLVVAVRTQTREHSGCE